MNSEPEVTSKLTDKPEHFSSAEFFLYQQLLKLKHQGKPMTLDKLAKTTDFSKSYLSQIFAEKKRINIEVFMKIYEGLGLPMEDLVLWLKYFFAEFRRVLSLMELQKWGLPSENVEAAALIQEKDFDLLSEWYFLPLLDLIRISKGTLLPELWCQLLKIETQQLQNALDRFKKVGLIELENNQYKVNSKIKFSTQKSKLSIRNYHRMMIEKSLLELEKIGDDDYVKRLITGFCFSIHSNKIPELRLQLARVIENLVQESTLGDANEVYQLNLQLFPLVSLDEVKTTK